jgi:hypothetical protein
MALDPPGWPFDRHHLQSGEAVESLRSSVAFLRYLTQLTTFIANIQEY